MGDDVDDLALINIAGEQAELRFLMRDYGVPWHTHSRHCHPTWSRDGSRIVYASDRGGV